MSILINGMEMPKEGSWKTVRIYPDGTCAVPNWQGDCTLIKGAQAVPVPPHGRLIDADAVIFNIGDVTYKGSVKRVLLSAPTIVQAEEGEQ